MQGPENSDNSGFEQIKEAFTNMSVINTLQSFTMGQIATYFVESDSGRQAASISRDEQSSLQFGDLLLASETATSARRKRVSLLTCMSMLAAFHQCKLWLSVSDTPLPVLGGIVIQTHPVVHLYCSEILKRFSPSPSSSKQKYMVHQSFHFCLSFIMFVVDSRVCITGILSHPMRASQVFNNFLFLNGGL